MSMTRLGSILVCLVAAWFAFTGTLTVIDNPHGLRWFGAVLLVVAAAFAWVGVAGFRRR